MPISNILLRFLGLSSKEMQMWDECEKDRTPQPPNDEEVQERVADILSVDKPSLHEKERRGA